MSSERPLSPLELAELEEQRRHLLSSLDDLDAEFAAGDIDEPDFSALRDDYTRRAANVLRAIESGRARIRAAAPSRLRRRRLFTLAAVVAVAGLAGVLLARSAGFRSSNDTATGDIRSSTRSLLLEAGEMAAAGDLDGAIERYDEVLEIQPSNVEALTYKGWYLYLSDESAGIEPEVEAALAAAVATDPSFPDARVFRAVLFTDQGRFDDATDELAAFDAADPAPQMVDLVTQQGLRERALAGLLRTDPPVGDIEVAAYGVSAEVMARAARILEGDGSAGVAIRAYIAALAADPDNVTALLGRGALLVRTGQQSQVTDPDTAATLIADGRASIDRAAEVAPTSAQARLLAAQVAVVTGDLAGARRHLDAVESLELTSDERAIADALRAAIESG